MIFSQIRINCIKSKIVIFHVCFSDYPNEVNGKKKKKKNKNGVSNGAVNSIPNNEPPRSNMVRLTMNGDGPAKRLMNPPQPMNGMRVMNSGHEQSAIIRMHGSMVTIRSPALEEAMIAKESAAEQAKKKKKKKKGGNGGGDESWNIDGELSYPPARKVTAFPFMYVLGQRED